jgi:hypothetical protein
VFGLQQLEDWHVEVLEWFERNAGRTLAARPFDVGLRIKVTSAQKGIWKPAGTPYAVSVVQTPKGVYADRDPIFRSEGSWEYFYHQEGNSAEDLADPYRLYSNAGLFRCWADGIPVGVVIPAESGRGYQVLGLALVAGYDQGLFCLQGPVSVGANDSSSAANDEVTVSLVDFSDGQFDPSAAEDSRLKVVAQVARRQGAPRFRRALLQAYEGKCAMSRYDAEPALEAAHIVPYRGPQTNHITNGLLLRADLHDLFDLGLLAVEPDSMKIRLSSELTGTMYEPLEGQGLWMPSAASLRPNAEALKKHFAESAVA